MNDQSDSQLLRAYARGYSEAAFAELVQRHVNFVYSAARRMVMDGPLAQDVAQGVFIALAKNASALSERPVLAGWLQRTAQNIAAQTVRTDVRRRRREQEAVAMNELLSSAADPRWEEIAPHLDAALNELNEADREMMFLRYFEKKTAAEIARALDITEEAAHKRAQRAVERLRELFARRGVVAGAGGLAAIVSAHAVQAAPAGLAATFTSAAVGAAILPAAGTTFTATKIIAMTIAQKLAVAASLSLLAGAGIYEACQAAKLREQNQSLVQQQGPLQAELQQLRQAQAARHQDTQPTPKAAAASDSNAELLKLRGDVAALRQQAADAAAKAGAANRALAEIKTAELKFEAYHAQAVNASKQTLLAMMVFANDNNGTFPTNLRAMTNELGTATFQFGDVDLYSFEYFNVNDLTTNRSNGIAMRERVPRQAPDRSWQRIYGLADGSVQTATSYDGNFDTWEKVNGYALPSPADQSQK